MKNLYFLFTFLAVIFVPFVNAQKKNIVYIRYSPADGNSAFVLRQLDLLWNMGDCIVFMSNGEKPLVATSYYDINEIKVRLSSMQSEVPYIGQSELEFFDSCFVSLLEETVTSQLKINGSRDNGSKCIFLLSENMFNNVDATEFLMEMIAVNDLDSRMDIAIYTYNDVAVVKKNSFKDKGKIKFLKK